MGSAPPGAGLAAHEAYALHRKGSAPVGAGLPTHGVKLAAAKAEREAQNDSCPGGLRNPNRAVSRLPPLRATGQQIRRILERLMTVRTVATAAEEAVDAIGSTGFLGFPETKLILGRAAF